MVRLYKEHFGRGPEAVETHFASPNLLVCVLTNSLTPVERNLRDIGETQRLRDIRMLFQHVAEPQFRALVETVSGRRVVGFMSGMDVSVDRACEVFSLAPADSGRAASAPGGATSDRRCRRSGGGPGPASSGEPVRQGGRSCSRAPRLRRIPGGAPGGRG